MMALERASSGLKAGGVTLMALWASAAFPCEGDVLSSSRWGRGPKHSQIIPAR